MTSKKRLKQLMSPDRLQLRFVSLWSWFAKHRKFSRFLFSICSILLLGWLSWYYYSSEKKEDLIVELNSIDRVYEKEEKLVQESFNKVIKEITQLRSRVDALKGANKGQKSKDKKDKQKKDIEKDAQIAKLEKLQEEKFGSLSSLGSAKVDHSVSAKKYLAFFQAHPQTAEGRRSALRSVNWLLEKKEFTKAADILKDIVSSSSEDDMFFTFQVRAMYLGVLEELGKTKEVLEQVALLEKYAYTGLRAKVLLIKAKALIIAKKYTEANEALTKITNDFSDSEEAIQAKRLNYLIPKT
jgi:hypothetical protein